MISSTSLPHYHSAPHPAHHAPHSSNLRAKIASSPASSSPNDPFSTPARRRRLIADIARFLLRQYCVKACEQVAHDRYCHQCAVRIQCFLRQFFAKTILRRLRFTRDTTQSLVIQRFYRCLIAREQLQDRIRNRWKAKYLAMVLRVQKKYRQHLHTQRYQLMLSSAVKMQRAMRVYQRRRERERRRLAEEQQKQKEEKAAIQIQCHYRAYRARAVYQELFLQYCHQKMMKFRILQSWRWSQQRKREAATLLIQSQFRILQSKRRFLKIQRIRLQERNERAEMAAEDLRSRYVHEHTIELTLCLHINTSLASHLRQFQILPFLCWCIQRHLLSFDSLSDSYAVGAVIRNLLAHWKESQHSSSTPLPPFTSQSEATPSSSAPLKRIEISNTSIQNDAPSSPDLISYPDSLQCPQDWGKKYPLISSTHHRPQTSFRSSTNRWGQIILSFDNFLSWSQLLGKSSTSSDPSSVPGNVYNLRIVFGEKDLDERLVGSNTTRQEEKIPELEFHDLEVVITVVTASLAAESALGHTSGMNSRQVVCRIENETLSGELGTTDGDLSSTVPAALTDLESSQAISQSGDREGENGGRIGTGGGNEGKGGGGDDEYEALIGEDISTDETSEGESVPKMTSQPLSRPTTATTRLYITAPPMLRALTEEEILEGHRAAARTKMIPIFEELLHKVNTSYLRKRQVKIDEFHCRIMASRIQGAYRHHLLHKRLSAERKIAAQKLQRFYQRYYRLRTLQRIVYTVLHKMHLVVYFVQQATRLRLAQRAVEMRRVAYCEDHQSLIAHLTQSLLLPYSWLDGDPLPPPTAVPISGDGGGQAALMRRISFTFLCDNPNPSSLPPPHSSSLSLLPSPPTNPKSSLSRQLSFLPFSSSSASSSDNLLSFSEDISQNTTFGNLSHWAEGLFQSLDLPKSSFQSPQGIDLVSSRHLLVASLPSSEEKISSLAAEEQEKERKSDEGEALHSQLGEWIQQIETNEMQSCNGCVFGDIQRGSRVKNLNKYRQGLIAEESDGMTIPPLLQVLKERYHPPPL